MEAPSNEVLGERVEQHDTRLNKIDIILEKIRNRPPVWVTAVIGVLLAVVGWLMKGV